MIKTVESNVGNGVSELIADSVEDKTKLQNGTIKYNVGAGSTCFVIEDSSVLMLDNTGTWREI